MTSTKQSLPTRLSSRLIRFFFAGAVLLNNDHARHFGEGCEPSDESLVVEGSIVVADH